MRCLLPENIETTMASIFRKISTRPLPKSAVIKSRSQKTKSGTKEDVLVATWTDGNGRTRTAPVTIGSDGEYRIQTRASTWTAKFRDGSGTLREVATGCRDRQAAQAVLNELTTRAELVKAKVLTIEQVDISQYQDTLLLEHIEAFLDYQRQKSTHPIRVKAYDTRLKESAAACGFKVLRDLSSDKLVTWLTSQVEGERNMSASVYNGFVEVWMAFGNWCIGKRTRGKKAHDNGQRRLLANPFEGLQKLDEKADRRRTARALTEDELQLLLDAARRRPLKDALTVRRGKNVGKQVAKLSEERIEALERLGHERSLIYKTAILTGLRANELRTLRVKDLSFGDVRLSGFSVQTKRTGRAQQFRCEVTWQSSCGNGVRRTTSTSPCSAYQRGSADHEP